MELSPNAHLGTGVYTNEKDNLQLRVTGSTKLSCPSSSKAISKGSWIAKTSCLDNAWITHGSLIELNITVQICGIWGSDQSREILDTIGDRLGSSQVLNPSQREKGSSALFPPTR